MHSFLKTLLLAVLLAGTSGNEITKQYFDKGDFVELVIVTLPLNVARCYLVTPLKTEIDLPSDTLNDKYEYRYNSLSTCMVRINDLDKDDEGVWSLHADFDNRAEVTQRQVAIRGTDVSEEDSGQNEEETDKPDENSSQNVEEEKESEENSSQTDKEDTLEENSSLNDESDAKSSEESETSKDTSKSESEELKSDSASSESSSSEEDTTITEWLTDEPLSFVTRTGLNVDINLPRSSHIESCIFETPEGRAVKLEESNIPGVTAHSSSDYVSCRIVVGPMEESLLGLWTLCGLYSENNQQHRRCLRANIVWRNANNPGSMWDTIIRPNFDHVVHFGGTLTPTVRGSGTVASCHIITPGNEDLYVTRDSNYPNIRLVQSTDSACSIAIGPIAEAHLGEWSIYGKFNSVLSGYNEVRSPVTLELYDKNNPYEQAYNVTQLTPTQHVINLGSTIDVEVTSTGAVDVCMFTMPSGVTYNSRDNSMPTGVAFVQDNRIACRLSIGPITENMLGQWTLNGKFSNRDIFTERVLGFTIIQEDPRNPIQEDRRVEYLTDQDFDTDIGATHRVIISSTFMNTPQSCHIRTPEGLQYTIMEGFNIPGIEVETGSGVSCGVSVKVSEDVIGSWTLIAREISLSELIERRLPFKIYVEEQVEALPNEITISEGNSIQVRLVNPTDLHSTCRLVGPDNQESPLTTADERHLDTCGFVVSSVDSQHSGTWNIVYGTKIIYKAAVVVNVNARVTPDGLDLSWLEHSPVSVAIGSEDAVYCKVLTPRGVVIFDDFGRCRIDLETVSADQHSGVWTMFVGMPGQIVTEEHLFKVTVHGTERKPEVLTNVLQNKPIVELTCSVKSEKEKTGCLFRNPHGKVLVASQGVSEGRYAFHVNQTSTEDGQLQYSCGLQITDPVTTDLGLWRCDLESQDDKYFGFLSVLCPWAMMDPDVASYVISEPVLFPDASFVEVEEGSQARLSCSARAPLRYCYFRSPNGTIFNVGLGSASPTFEYLGAGLDAGECGMLIRGLEPQDQGLWSCHAGFHNRPEQFAMIDTSIKEKMVLYSSQDHGRLRIEGYVGYRPLEYCRFVRHDGFGFTSDDPPYPYVDESNLALGWCRMSVAFSSLDLRPWTVVAKVMGRDGEISRVVTQTVQPTPVFRYNTMYMWLPFVMIFSFALMLAAALAPAKNRRWASERASTIRTSFRRLSFRKKPAQVTDTNPAA